VFYIVTTSLRFELHLRLEPDNSRYSYDMATFTLYGIVQGDTTVFAVTVPADECVSGLKKLIYQEGKKGIFHKTDAKELSLWVVSTFQRS
jgi:Crinkler effector protein N-terminal domain